MLKVVNWFVRKKTDGWWTDSFNHLRGVALYGQLLVATIPKLPQISLETDNQFNWNFSIINSTIRTGAYYTNIGQNQWTCSPRDKPWTRPIRLTILQCYHIALRVFPKLFCIITFSGQKTKFQGLISLRKEYTFAQNILY